MTVAALGAMTLNDCLENIVKKRSNLSGLTKIFQKRLAKINANPWISNSAEINTTM